MIGHAAERFQPGGSLTDEPTRDLIRILLHHLVEWTDRITNR
jgi:hypothetical protein